MKQNQKDTIRMELKRLRADIVTYQGEMNGRLARILDEAKMTTFGDDNSVLIIAGRCLSSTHKIMRLSMNSEIDAIDNYLDYLKDHPKRPSN